MHCQTCVGWCPKHDGVLPEEETPKDAGKWFDEIGDLCWSSLAQQRIKNSFLHWLSSKPSSSKELRQATSDVTKHQWILDEEEDRFFPQLQKCSEIKSPQTRRPLRCDTLTGRYFCMSITVPDFRFSSSWIFILRQSPPTPPDTSQPWEASGPWWEERGRKRFYPNTISRLNLEFPVLNKMKVCNKGPGGVVRMGEICPLPPPPPPDWPPTRCWLWGHCGRILVARLWHH